MGAQEPAFLLRSTVNLEQSGSPRHEHLSTGLYTLMDVICSGCHSPMGWQYLQASHEVCSKPACKCKFTVLPVWHDFMLFASWLIHVNLAVSHPCLMPLLHVRIFTLQACDANRSAGVFADFLTQYVQIGVQVMPLLCLLTPLHKTACCTSLLAEVLILTLLLPVLAGSEVQGRSDIAAAQHAHEGHFMKRTAQLLASVDMHAVNARLSRKEKCWLVLYLYTHICQPVL